MRKTLYKAPLIKARDGPQDSDLELCMLQFTTRSLARSNQGKQMQDKQVTNKYR